MSQVGVADRNEIGSFRKELQIEQTQDSRFGLLARFVMLELKGIDAGLRLQPRAFVVARPCRAEFEDGTAPR
jgi:hypothetical protein